MERFIDCVAVARTMGGQGIWNLVEVADDASVDVKPAVVAPEEQQTDSKPANPRRTPNMRPLAPNQSLHLWLQLHQ